MRLVSLCPSLTELVFALGRGDALVGRTKFCIHPAAGVAAIETLGGTKNPKIARIVALDPDLVLMNEEENRREDADALAAAGVRLHVSFPRDAVGTAAMVRDVGRALGAPDAAAVIAGAIEARAAQVRAAAAARAAQGEAPVRWAYLIWRRPWMAAGPDTFVSALFAGAGGENVCGATSSTEAAPRYPEVTADALRTAHPDAVFLSSEPFPFTDRHADELAAATGLPRDRFRLVDGELLSWHGARTADGVDYADALLQDVRSRRGE